MLKALDNKLFLICVHMFVDVHKYGTSCT